MNSQLDARYFFPEVFQAVAGNDHVVYAYMNDGAVRKVDMKPYLEKGGVFEPLKNKDIFQKTLTVIGNTVAWDLNGDRDGCKCIDLDPFDVFDCPVVPDIPEDIQNKDL